MNSHLGFSLFVALAGLVSNAAACTRVLWAENAQPVVAGRNMDWQNPMPVDLWLLPRGIERDGATGPNTLKWRAKYGSVVASKEGASDGLNEKGLAAHLLWLSESDYGKRNPAAPGLSTGYWLQYYLDNFATVEEAVAWTTRTQFQMVTGVYDGRTVTVHLALEDAHGDSAIIEYLDGKPRIHHDRRYTVLTNSPTFDEQLANLERYRGFGGDQPLPGTSQAADRYVRAAFYLKHLPLADNYREIIAGVLSVLRNVAQPFGTFDPARPNISPTRWRTVSDLTNGIYFFESSTSPNLVWINLKKLDFSEGTSVKRLNLTDHPDRVGDVTDALEPAVPFAVPPPHQDI